MFIQTIKHRKNILKNCNIFREVGYYAKDYSFFVTQYLQYFKYDFQAISISLFFSKIFSIILSKSIENRLIYCYTNYRKIIVE